MILRRPPTDGSASGTGGGAAVAPEISPNAHAIRVTVQATDWFSGDEGGVQVALSTILTPELKREGMRNDFIRQVQNLRKEAGLEIQDRIRIYYASAGGHVDDEIPLKQMCDEWADYVCDETLSDSLKGEVHRSEFNTKGYVGDVETVIFIEKT